MMKKRLDLDFIRSLNMTKYGRNLTLIDQKASNGSPQAYRANIAGQLRMQIVALAEQNSSVTPIRSFKSSQQLLRIWAQNRASILNDNLWSQLAGVSQAVLKLAC